MHRFCFGAFSALVISILSLTVADRAVARNVAFDQMFVFGDSLSSTGNVFIGSGGTTPDPDAYFKGRFSNGPVWVERLATVYGVSLTPSLAATDVTAQSINFAWGGAQTGISNLTPDGVFTVPGVNGQISGGPADLYLPPSFSNMLSDAGVRANQDALYVIWGGANDFLIPPPNGIPPATSAANISNAITTLYDLGARHFLVLNLPDLGTTPLAQLIGAAEPLSDATTAFNGLLAAELATLQASASLPDIKIIDPHIDAVFATILADPGDLGFTDPATQPVFGAGPASGCLITTIFPPCGLADPDPADGFFWYDEQHPTKAVHTWAGLGAFIAVRCVRENFRRRFRNARCVARATRDFFGVNLLALEEKSQFIGKVMQSDN